MAPNKMYDQIPAHRYAILRERYDRFMENLTDPKKDVVKIFDPLGPKQLQELELIREVSEELQRKKDEDMKKAAQAAEDAKEAEAKAALEKKENSTQEATENGAEPETTDKAEKK